MADTRLLAAIRPDQMDRYQQHLSAYDDFALHIVPDIDNAKQVIADQHVDVFVVDNELGQVYEFVTELRQTYPRLLIILVDEEADFAMPGQADAISTDPFNRDELANNIRRMMSERKMETLRSDSLPAVRSIAKRMREATGILGKHKAAVEVCFNMNYDYVAYYDLRQDDPIALKITAQEGPRAITSIAPEKAEAGDLIGWVAQNGQSRIAAPEDSPNHPLVARGRLGAVACVPVSFSGRHFGVIAACRDRPGSITQDNVLMLELVAAQLASALLKEK